MLRNLFLFLVLLLLSCSNEELQLAGTWKLEQETTSTGAPLSSGKGALIIDESGSYKMFDEDTATGRWYVLKNRDTDQLALRLDAQEGIFSIYAIDSLTKHKLILRSGFGRRMVFVK